MIGKLLVIPYFYLIFFFKSIRNYLVMQVKELIILKILILKKISIKKKLTYLNRLL